MAAAGGEDKKNSGNEHSKEEAKPNLVNSKDSSSTTDFLREYLARSLGIADKPEQKLQEVTLEGIAKFLASDQCKNVITMAGAGISTSAGIPDFRTPGTGLYDNLQSYDLPSPQAIFDIEFFMENPKPFFVLAKELYPGLFKPTVCHYFIKMLNDKGKLLRHYTQNIDTLEREAGITSEKLIEAHGTFHTAHCLTCQKLYEKDWVKEQIFADKIPTCALEGCEGVVKPDIVFFGEALPVQFANAVQTDFKKCDLLLVTGTSLMVQPFASLVDRVPAECPRLLINLEKPMGGSNPLAVLFFGGGGFEFDSEDNYRDVFKESTCDEGCQELADLLGWGDELKEIVKREHGRIDKENAKTKPGETDKKKPEAQTKTTKASGPSTSATASTSGKETKSSDSPKSTSKKPERSGKPVPKAKEKGKL